MSVIHHFIGEKNNFNWEDVDLTVFDGSDGSKDASRRLLITEEREGAQNFVFRYFRVLPGGSSTKFDQHVHDHGILILHGHALLKLNDKEYHAGPMDVIYITPQDVHHLIVEGDEALGFLCVIPNKKKLAAGKTS
jgi:quercetin dioxygenase-like cupin family protein